MKKLASLMLGLSLIVGSASFAFAAEEKKEEKKETKKGKKGKKAPKKEGEQK